MQNRNYFWGGVNFPHFYPAPDTLNPDKYIVEFSLVCYPYRNSLRFDAMAFPPELRRFGINKSTKFTLLMRDEQGNAYENLEWDEAAIIADGLNDSYHFLIDDCVETYDWDNFPIEIDVNDILFSK